MKIHDTRSLKLAGLNLLAVILLGSAMLTNPRFNDMDILARAFFYMLLIVNAFLVVFGVAAAITPHSDKSN